MYAIRKVSLALSLAAWQTSASDHHIETIIRYGAAAVGRGCSSSTWEQKGSYS